MEEKNIISRLATLEGKKTKKHDSCPTDTYKVWNVEINIKLFFIRLRVTQNINVGLIYFTVDMNGNVTVSVVNNAK